MWAAVPDHLVYHDLDGALIGQCQGEPACRLTRGISTDTRYVPHRRLSQLDPAVIDVTKDVEGIDGGDRLAKLACWQLQGSPLCPRGTIAMLQEPCLPKPKLKIGSNQWRISCLTVCRGFLVFDLDDKLTRHHQHPSCTVFSAEQAVNGTG